MGGFQPAPGSQTVCKGPCVALRPETAATKPACPGLPVNPFTCCSSTYGSGSNILGAAAAAAIAAVTALPPDLQLLTAEASGVRLRPDSSPDRALTPAEWLPAGTLVGAGD